MQKSKFLSVLQRIESDEITTSELAALFYEMLYQGLSTDQQLALCRRLAQQQHDYAASADPRLEGWITAVATALKAAGADAPVVREVSAALLIGTYLHDAKFVHAPQHPDSTALTVALHATFVGKRRAARANADTATGPRASFAARLVLILTGHPGYVVKGALMLMLAASIFIHIPMKGRPALCPKNSVAVYGKRFLPLPDGSELILDSNESSVCFAYPFYSNGRREMGVRAGTTYCEITADPQNPFFVHAPGGIVTEVVMGSGLNLHVDEKRQVVDISIAHGKALVHYDGKKYEVTAGQQLSFAMQTKAIQIESFDPATVTWPYPRLSFEGATLAEFARVIGQRYHISVEFSHEALKKTRITAYFQSDAVQLQQIIRSLEIALGDVEMTLTETTLKISRKR